MDGPAKPAFAVFPPAVKSFLGHLPRLFVCLEFLLPLYIKMADLAEGQNKKRKFTEGEELQIDLSAPEPPSKKALRQAKKKGTEPTSEPATESRSEAPASQTEKRSDYGIWIGNLAFSVTRDDLRKFLSSNCSFADTVITRIHLPKSSETAGSTKNKGFAYIDFSNEKALQEALGLSEQLLAGRRVLIKNAKNYEGRPIKPQEEEQKTSSASNPGMPPSKRIFVGNLSFDTTKETLEEHFGQCGPVKSIHMATFQDTGNCKGYAWVEFELIPAAEAAVRGFMMVNEDDEEEDSEEDPESESKDDKRKKSKKPKQRKVWVNQLLGRRMRTEFAENPTTRYEKRFGKGRAQKSKNASESASAENGAGEGEQSVQERPRRTKPQPEYNRYDQDTVQKLSGAIVESQGKKITFD